jgi:hypothetical protein
MEFSFSKSSNEVRWQKLKISYTDQFTNTLPKHYLKFSLLVGPGDLAKNKRKHIHVQGTNYGAYTTKKEQHVFSTYFTLLHSDTDLDTNIFIPLDLGKIR